MSDVQQHREPAPDRFPIPSHPGLRPGQPRQPPRPLTWRTLILIGSTALLFGSLLAVTQTGHLEPFAWRRALAWSLVLFLLILAFEAVLRWRPGANHRR